MQALAACSLLCRSWNREPPLGYRVANVQLSPDGRTAAGHSIFAEGWLDEGSGQPWGRPVGLLRLPDSSMLVADDHANVVYRIAFNETRTNAADGLLPSRSHAALLLLTVALAIALC